MPMGGDIKIKTGKKKLKKLYFCVKYKLEWFSCSIILFFYICICPGTKDFHYKLKPDQPKELNKKVYFLTCLTCLQFFPCLHKKIQNLMQKIKI